MWPTMGAAVLGGFITFVILGVTSSTARAHTEHVYDEVQKPMYRPRTYYYERKSRAREPY